MSARRSKSLARHLRHPIGFPGTLRAPSIWLWHVTVTIPGPPFGDAKNIGEAKARFKEAWAGGKLVMPGGYFTGIEPYRE